MLRLFSLDQCHSQIIFLSLKFVTFDQYSVLVTLGSCVCYCHISKGEQLDCKSENHRMA